MVHHQAVDDVVAQAVGIGGIMPERGKPSGPRIVPVQCRHTCRTTGNRSDPRRSRSRSVGEVRRSGPGFRKKLYSPLLPSIRVSPRLLPTQMFSWLSAYTAVTDVRKRLCGLSGSWR